MTGDGLCAGCGDPMPRGRQGEWCSSWCRSRAEQGLEPQRPPGLAPLSPVRVDLGRGASVDVPAREATPLVVRRSLADKVAEQLRGAGVDSWEAEAAVDLAEAIEGARGSARAALHRELRAIMAQALRGVDEAGSSVKRYADELEARRARRAGGAG